MAMLRPAIRRCRYLESGAMSEYRRAEESFGESQGVVNPLKQMGLLHIPGAVDEGELLADLVHRVDRHGGGRATAARQPASASLSLPTTAGGSRSRRIKKQGGK